MNFGELIAAGSATLLLAFGQTYWSVSTGTEVYSLQCLLLSIAFWQAIKCYKREGTVKRDWLIFGSSTRIVYGPIT